MAKGLLRLTYLLLQNPRIQPRESYKIFSIWWSPFHDDTVNLSSHETVLHKDYLIFQSLDHNGFILIFRFVGLENATLNHNEHCRFPLRMSVLFHSFEKTLFTISSTPNITTTSPKPLKETMPPKKFPEPDVYDDGYALPLDIGGETITQTLNPSSHPITNRQAYLHPQSHINK